jgi:hypothetical protein
MANWSKWYGGESAPRDIRRTDPVHPPKPPGKKDRAKWCRGKVGVEHTPEVMIPVNSWSRSFGRTCGPISWDPTRWACYHSLVCTTCGKHLSHRVTVEECRAS